MMSQLFGGTLLFHGISINAAYVMLIAAAIAVGVAAWMQTGRAHRWVKRGASGLRLVAVALLVLVLMEPVVRSEELAPQQSYLAHVFDISASMGIADMDRKPRAQALNDATARETELDRLYRRLAFTFDESAHAMPGAFDWTPGERGTDLAAAIESVTSRTTGLPLTGIVVYSDGNATVNANADSIVTAAEGAGVPIYTVGAAPAEPPPDVWIEDVIHPQEAAEGASTRVSVLVGTRGMQGRTMTVSLSGADGPIEERRVRAERGEQTLAVEFEVRPKGFDTVYYDTVVSHSAEEAYPWNNARSFFMSIAPGKRRVLYVEGSPRYEYRFLRAAFANDERFQVTSMVFVTRGGDTYRQGLRFAGQLRGGFPTTEEELFGYDVIIVGDVAAGHFARESLEGLREFVRKRGGGLLFLGGERSFADNGFGRTALADVLPFDLEHRSTALLQDAYPVAPTQTGIEQAVFGPDPNGAARPWDTLPALTGLYALGGTKPGATVLCEAETGRGDRPPLVVYQRYGRGVSLVCGISATWPWKFQTPADDPRYGAFWKSMILVLTAGNRGRLEIAAEPREAAPGEIVELSGAVLSADFELDRSARVALSIRRPDGSIEEVNAQPLITEGQTFQYAFTPDKPGVYRVTAQSQPDGSRETLERSAIISVKEDTLEFQDVNLNAALLARVADATGGAYVHLSDLDQLADRITPRDDALRIPHHEPLWDHPLLFALVLGALVGEWFLRRSGGLA